MLTPASAVRAIADAVHHNPGRQSLNEWWSLASGHESFSARSAEDATGRNLRFLSLDTTSACNLTCPGMCYYHGALAKKKVGAPIDAFERAIDSATLELGAQAITFAGKEPLVDIDRLSRLARYANRTANRNYAIGVVTNGTLIERNWQQLNSLVEEGSLDFIDVSIDAGDAASHDRIRGKAGTFDAAQAAFKRMLDSWLGIRLGVTSVLRNDNCANLISMLVEADERIRNFFVFPIQPPVFEGGSPLEWSTILDCVKRISVALEGARQNSGIDVTVSLLGLHLWDAVQSGVLDLSRIKEDDNGQIYYQSQIRGNTLTLLLQVLPETGRHTLRILHSGEVLPNTHYLQSPSPDTFAVGNISDESLTAIYGRGCAAGSALARLWESRDAHECRNNVCWPLCFGGLSVADSSMVTGDQLDRKPALCLVNGDERSLSYVNREFIG